MFPIATQYRSYPGGCGDLGGQWRLIGDRGSPICYHRAVDVHIQANCNKLHGRPLHHANVLIALKNLGHIVPFSAPK